jgi:hypothetical protein
MYEPVIKKPTTIPLFVKTENFVTNNQHEVDKVPHILATGLRIGQSRNKYVFKCLLDSGGTDPMINRKCIPSSVKLDACPSIRFATTQGKFASVYWVVKLRDLCLPESSLTNRFGMIKAYVFDAPNCPYDILLVQKFLKLAKMQHDIAKGQTAWLGATVLFILKGTSAIDKAPPAIGIQFRTCHNCRNVLCMASAC